MFRVPLRFTLHKTLLKRRVTELSNLRGLAQVRAVGKTGRRSLCFHKNLTWMHRQASELRGSVLIPNGARILLA